MIQATITGEEGGGAYLGAVTAPRTAVQPEGEVSAPHGTIHIIWTPGTTEIHAEQETDTEDAK